MYQAIDDWFAIMENNPMFMIITIIVIVVCVWVVYDANKSTKYNQRDIDDY